MLTISVRGSGGDKKFGSQPASTSLASSAINEENTEEETSEGDINLDIVSNENRNTDVMFQERISHIIEQSLCTGDDTNTSGDKSRERNTSLSKVTEAAK